MATGIFKLRDQLLGLVQKAWGGTLASTYQGNFNGSSSITPPANSAFTFGTGDFTIEGWVWSSNAISTANGIFQQGTSFPQTSTSNTVAFGTVNSGQTWQIYAKNTNTASSATWVINTWYYFAVVRNSGTTVLYINGIAVITVTADTTNYTGTYFGIGEIYSNVGYHTGYISNFRVVKGTALYTANFAPPTGPLTAVSGTQLLTLQNATIVDNSSNAFTITNNGSTTTSIAYPFSVVNTATPAVDYLVVAGGGSGGSTNAGGGGGGGLLSGILPITPSVTLTVTVGGGGAGGSSVGASGANSVFSSITSTGGGAGGSNGNSALNGGSGGGDQGGYAGLTPGQGIVGQGNNGGGGNISGTGLLSPNYPSSGGGGAGTVGLSITSASSQGQNGGAGIASAILGTIYTFSGGGGGAAYGVNGGNGGVGGGGGGGSAPGSGTPGTGGTGYNSGSNAVVGAGGAGGVNAGGGAGGGRAQSTGANGGSGIVIISYPDTYNAPTTLTGTYTASTSGSGSLSFNGSSQYITTPTSSNLALGTSNFSVEAWVYKTSTSGNQLAIGSSVTGNLDPILLYFNNGSNNAVLYLSSNGSTFDIASAVSIGTVSLNIWAHLAVTRVGSTFTTYLNGVQTSTFTSSASIYKSVNTFTLGAGQTSFNYFNGYMSNVRIVIGASAYSAPFTPSTTPLTPIANTQLLLNTVSGAQFADSSTNSLTLTATGSPTWNQLSPFATGLGYKNRVYTWTGSGTVTF